MRNQKAFTIIEILAVIAVLLIVTAGGVVVWEKKVLQIPSPTPTPSPSLKTLPVPTRGQTIPVSCKTDEDCGGEFYRLQCTDSEPPNCWENKCINGKCQQIKISSLTIDPGYSREIIEVKFVEGSGVRLRNGKLVSLTGQDLGAVYKILNQYNVLKIERLFTLPEEKLEEMKKPGIASLNLWYRITLDKGARTEEFINALNSLAIVEKAEPAPLPAPPPGR